MRESTFRKRFGRAVKAAREEKGLTQREAAEAAEIAEKYLSRIEIGLATPSVHVALRLGHALDVGLDELIGDSAKPRQPALGSIVRLLRGRSTEELERVRRMLAELLR
jgi:transcriptional regulator with XRE-family HTH domain